MCGFLFLILNSWLGARNSGSAEVGCARLGPGGRNPLLGTRQKCFAVYRPGIHPGGFRQGKV